MSLATIVHATPETQPFTVSVTVPSHSQAAKVTVIVRELGQWVEYAAERHDGTFTVKGKIPEPSFAFVVLKNAHELHAAPHPGNVLNLFIEPMSIVIESGDSLSQAVVHAGTLQKELEVYNEEVKELRHQHNVPDNETRYEFAKAFISQHPNSMVSLFAIQNFMLELSFVTNATFSDSLFQLLDSSVQATESAVKFHEDIVVSKKTAIGSPAPDFTQADTTGQHLSLSTLRGKYVLIDFWASWCKPCRAENPALVQTYHHFKDKNFTILGVSLDNNKENWMKAIHKDHLTWYHVSDLKFWKNEVALLYGVSTLPQNYLLDPSGKIIAKNIKTEELKKTLVKLLGAE